MKLLIIADDEFVVRRVPAVPVDLLVSLGDMPEAVIHILADRCRPQTVLAVKGNHDSATPFRAPVKNLHLGTVKFGGLVFGGFGGSWRYKPVGHHLFEQEGVEHLLATFPPVDVFVAHNSPRMVHDRDDEVHIGFHAFNTYINRHQPKYFLHGHQHHDEETVVAGTRVIGILGHRFLDLPDGHLV
jgi:Icc-related predicted phosphoesterase